MKRQIQFVTLFLCLTLLLCPVANASSDAAQEDGTRQFYANALDPAAVQALSEETFCDVGAGLSVLGGGLYKSAHVMYSSGNPMTFYTVTLQRKVSGSWEDYESVGGVSTNNPITYGAYTYPPKGYTYRVRVEAASTDFPGMICYSANVDY